MAAHSDGIWLVRPAKPPERVELISILPAGSTYEGRNQLPYFEPDDTDLDPGMRLDRHYPPYRRVWHRFVVVADIKPAAGVAVGDTLELCEADSRRNESVHRDYYMGGFGRSWAVTCYRASAPIGEDQDRLTFAVRREGHWSLTVVDAFESADLRADVEKVIACERHGGTG
jgi:hypothetical protein